MSLLFRLMPAEKRHDMRWHIARLGRAHGPHRHGLGFEKPFEQGALA
jgi:hypothetical protein